MNLNIFKETIKRKEITVEDEGQYIDVFYNGRLCAKIFMNKDFAYLVDTSVVPITFRRQLTASVEDFTNTPFHKRRNTVVARHSNHMYIKSVDMETYYNSFTAKVEMTGDEKEADRIITSEKREALAKLFGKEIHYVEVIE